MARVGARAGERTTENGFRIRTLASAFEETAARVPEKVALVVEDDRYTYADLSRLAGETARGLLALGIEPAARVAIWLPNSLEWVTAALATAMVGAVTVPVNMRYRREEAEYILSQSEASLLLMTDRVAATDYTAMLADICPELREAEPGALYSATLPNLRHVLSVAETGLKGIRPFSDLGRLGRGVDAGALAEVGPRIDPESVAHIQYTSGTTARPKGAMLTHHSLLRDSYEICQAMRIGEADSIFSALPFFHIAGYASALLSALQMGGSLVTANHFDASKSLRLIERERCTMIRGVETMFVMMMAHPEFEGRDLSSLRGGVCGSYTLEVLNAVYERMGIKEMTSVFGLSETSSASTMTRVEDPLEKRLTTQGRPLPGIEVRIVDPGSNQPLGSEHRGEIVIRGWNLMKGYYEKPTETSEAIDSGGWLHTGDLGYFDGEGYLHFIDRIKDVVRVGGENVSAAEVESFLYRHPKVEMCQIVAGPDGRLGEVCVAYVKLKPGSECSADEIIEFYRGQIASFKIPRYVFFTEEFPITGSGKVQKFLLRERARQDVAAASRIGGDG